MIIFSRFFSRSRKLARLIVNEVREHAFNSMIAVALGMFFVWLLPHGAPHGSCCHSHSPASLGDYKNLLFHSLHYSHTFFASVTATLTAMRFSKNILKSILVGMFVPPVFCTASDILFPYWGGKLAGVEMSLHLCVIQNIGMVSLLILLGVAIGLVGSSKASQANAIRLAASSHLLHDFVSAAASLSYLVSFGYYGWTSNLIYVFILMLVSVMLPCMMSDFILPMFICASTDESLDDNCGNCCAYSFSENPVDEKNCKDGRN